MSQIWNRRGRGTTSAFAIAALAMLAPAAHAASYGYFYQTAATNYNTTPAGSTLTLKVYLAEVDNSNDPNVTHSLINDEDGLAGGAFTVTRTSGTASSLTGVAGNVGTAPSGFNGAVNTYGSGNARSVSEHVDQSVDLFAPGVRVFAINPGGFNAVLLGTVTILVANGATTEFTVSPYAGDATVTNASSYNLDDNLAGGDDNSAIYSNATPTKFLVTAAAAVPEPTTAALVAAALTLAARRRRRD